ncbi:MAG: undecaprenyl-diphosphate phosphatase [Endomicrobiales bacterium]|nr:undecaprenyl-diphosphate phosphatase [Endomicrobiales bacterium]
MIDSIILGIVQGITEFLPISSSGHLVFFQSLLGWAEPGIWFDIILHTSTLCAICYYFRKDLKDIVLYKDIRTVKLIVIASIPTGLIGYLGKDLIEHSFGSVKWSAFFLIITGILLFLTKYLAREKKGISGFSITDAIIVGTMQGFAILPGISRAGSTIAVAMLLGWERKQAARFSFLLAIPAISGATLLGLKEFSSSASLPVSSYVAGFITAFISGLFAIYFLFKVLFKNKFHSFAYYCWVLGLIILIFAK